MSDIETGDVAVELPPLVGMLLVEWQKNRDNILVLDDKLQTDAGATAISKRCLDNLDQQIATQMRSTIKNIFDGLTVQDHVALIYLLNQATADYKPAVKSFIETEQAKMPTQTIPEAEVNQFREERKDAVKAANALRTAVLTAVPAWANEVLVDENGEPRLNSKGEPLTKLDSIFTEQSNLRGSGPRAKSPRLKGSFIWVVDNEPVDGERVADVAKSIGVSVADFKNGLIANMKERGVEFDFAEPPQSFSFDLLHGDPEDENGHTIYKISARRKDSDPESDDEDDDEAFDEPDENDDLFQ